MSDPNYTKGALKGLLSIIKGATPENQPSEAVLTAYTKLLELEQQPDAEELKEIREELAQIRARMVSLPADVNQNRQKRLLMQKNGRRTG